MTFNAIWSSFVKINRGAIIQALLWNALSGLLFPFVGILAAQTLAYMFSWQSVRASSFGLTQYPWVIYLLPIFLLLYEVANQKGIALREILGGKLVEMIKHEVFAAQFLIPYSYYAEKGYEKFLLRHTADLSAVQQWLSLGVFAAFRDALYFLLGVFFLVWAFPSIAAGVLLAIGTTIFILIRRYQKTGLLEEEKREAKSAFTVFVATRLKHYRSVVVLNKIGAEEKRYRALAQKVRLANESIIRRNAQTGFIAALLSYFTLIVLIFLTYKYFETAEKWLLLSAVFIVFSWRSLLPRLFKRIWLWEKMSVSRRNLARFWSLKASSKPEIKEITPQSAILAVENLELQGTPHSPFSFTLAPKTVGVIIAPNDTFIHQFLLTLAKFENPKAGNIFYNNLPISPFNLRRRITVVSQFFPLYGKNLLESIAYSRKQTDLEAARRLWENWQQLFSTISTLPLLTRLHDPFIQLPDGQLLLCLFARAFLTGKKIIVVENTLEALPSDDKALLIQLLNQKLNEGLSFLWLSAQNPGDYIHSKWTIALGNDKP